MILPAVRAPLAAGRKVRVELTLPPARGGSGRPRHVRYAATVVRVTPLGKWTGIAVRFGKKLA